MARGGTGYTFEDLQNAEPSPRRRRHPIRGALITLVVLAALLFAGYLVAEPLAEGVAKQAITAGVAKQLGADPSGVHVDLGKGSVLLQLVHQKIDRVHVVVDSFTSADLSGSAVFDATAVPLQVAKPVGTATITVKLDSTALTTLVTRATGSSTTTAGFAGPRIRLGSSITILRRTLPVSIDFDPSVSAGQLLLTPATITIGGTPYTAAQLQASPIGLVAGSLLAPRTECVASSLPANMTLTGAAVQSNHLVVTVAGSNLALASLGTKGSCPS